jgi:hypothetical protein
MLGGTVIIGEDILLPTIILRSFIVTMMTMNYPVEPANCIDPIIIPVDEIVLQNIEKGLGQKTLHG